MEKNQVTAKILFRIALVLLFIPMIQGQFNWIKVGKLGGYEPVPENVSLMPSNWIDASYQKQKEQYIKGHFGFRNWALRLNHQLVYSLYNASKVHAVVIGKEGYLFDHDYILEYNGKFEVKEEEINQKLYRLKRVQDTLQKLGKHLFVVIGPNKADFFPEYLPAKDQIPREGLKTNYDHYMKQMAATGINYIDANGWFMQMKENSPYPLFPQTGIHFSFYGAALFADTIVQHVENALGKDLPDFGWTDVAWNEEPQEEDDDLEEALNLMFDIPSYRLPYPAIAIKEKGKYKPRSLTIGDSFYWRFVNWGGLNKIYNDGQFWYYNRDAHPGPRQVADLDFAHEVNKAEVICLLMASVNLWRFGFDFDDQLYQHFFGDEANNENDLEAKIQAKIEEAKSNPEWLAYIAQRAKEKGISLEDALKQEATFIIRQEAGLVD